MIFIPFMFFFAKKTKNRFFDCDYDDDWFGF